MTARFQHISIIQAPTHLLGNVTDLLVDVGEDVLLDCNDMHNDIVDYEWYRKEEHWFNHEMPTQRLIYKEPNLWINEDKVITVLYKCIARTNKGVQYMKSFRLYVDRVPRKQRGNY